MSLTLKKVERPRELKWYQAASMLYGDWGTSKAYVLGLAFAIAGHASLFYLLAMSVLTAIVGFCYIIICKAHPDGGGVYSSVKGRSRTLAVIGALLLIADYVVTASISSVEAFHYLGVPNPAQWAIGALVVIGAINVLGPTKSGNIATVIALMTLTTLIALCVIVLPHIRDVQISLPHGSMTLHWTRFVGIVLALSGVEAIANSTGIMVEPVKKTAKRAILPVLIEVTVISLILGAAMNAIPGLQGRTEDMIRAIGEFYVGSWFGKIIAVVIGLLLISACNTAIMDLVSVLFLMSKDKELPNSFGWLNRYGMPWIGLILATAVPVIVLSIEHDVQHLAALYAIGVVGAITINLGSTATDRNLGLKAYERLILGAATLVMLLIEITIFFLKPHAVLFAACILSVVMTARYVARLLEKPRRIPEGKGINVLTVEEARDLMPLYRGSTLVALKALSPSLVEEAVLHAKGKSESVLYALYVEEKPPGWAYPEEAEPSEAAVKVLTEAIDEFGKRGITAVPLWNLSDDAGGTIVKTSKELDLDTVMIGATRRGAIERMLRGEVFKRITSELPKEKHLVICN